MKRIAATIAMVLAATGGLAADRYVTVPDTTWSELLPYLEASLRVEFVDGRIKVGVSAMPSEGKPFEPYDESLGELATVLLGEAVSDRQFGKIVSRASREIGDSPETMSRDELTAAFWRKLAADDRFTGRLESLFAKAHAEGRLECGICDAGFEPRHLSVQ